MRSQECDETGCALRRKGTRLSLAARAYAGGVEQRLLAVQSTTTKSPKIVVVRKVDKRSARKPAVLDNGTGLGLRRASEHRSKPANPSDSGGGRELSRTQSDAANSAASSISQRQDQMYSCRWPASQMCGRDQASIVRWPGILVCHLAVHFACPAVKVDSSNLPPPSK